jgi:hypothetical protein
MRVLWFERKECEACGRRFWFGGVQRFGLWFCEPEHVPIDWLPYLDRLVRTAGV